MIPAQPIARLLAVIFGGLVALAVAVSLLLGLGAARSNNRALLAERTQTTIENMRLRLLAHVGPAVGLIAGTAAALRPGMAPRDIALVLRGAMGAAASVDAIMVIQADGTGFWLEKQAPDTVQALPFDAATTAQILARSQRLTGPVWLPPREHERRGQATIQILSPLPGQGALLAVLELTALSGFLADMPTPIGEVPFILYGRDVVVAHPALTGSSRLPQRSQASDPTLAAFEPRFDQGARPPTVSVATGRTVAYRLQDAGTDEPWVMGVHYGGNLIAAEMKQVQLAALAGVAVLAVALVLAAVFGRRVARPAAALAAAARRVAIDGPEAPFTLAPSRIAELNEASTAFASMVEGLRDRQRMRTVFGRYVPDQVVEQALSHQDGIAPERRDVAVLFTDIAGWTSLAESLPADQVMEILNRYLDRVVPVIDAHGGIVVDFIGDAVFALFGAPVAAANPAGDAIAAALAINAAAEAVRAEVAATGVALGETRIGVHAGPATVGSFGSKDRMKYGAAGDVVNTGSRLEGANKYFGSRILVSGAVLASAGAAAPAVRALGQLQLAGRGQSLAVAVLLPANGESDQWAAVFKAIEADDPAAVTLLAAYAEQYPEDPVASYYRTRLDAGDRGTTIILGSK